MSYPSLKQAVRLSAWPLSFLAVLGFWVGCAPDTATPESAVMAAAEPMSPEAMVERGEYIVSTAGCHDCHTPWHVGPQGPEPDMTQMLSGHPSALELPPPPDLGDGPWVMTAAGTNTAWAGPWGISYTANLTSDAETGLGGWSESMFVDAMRNGKHMGSGRPILPPMPWTVYRNLTDEDLKSIFAYLQTVPAISNRVPEPVPPM